MKSIYLRPVEARLACAGCAARVHRAGHPAHARRASTGRKYIDFIPHFCNPSTSIYLETILPQQLLRTGLENTLLIIRVTAVGKFSLCKWNLSSIANVYRDRYLILRIFYVSGSTVTVKRTDCDIFHTSGVTW